MSHGRFHSIEQSNPRAAVEAPESPGQAYEQALRKAKPQFRKARGVYYTPAPLAEHVVERTIGRLLEDQSTRPVRILDPACGAGVFLVLAYRRLLAWYAARHGRLTMDQRARILLDSIHGVDIDPHAVAMTEEALRNELMDGDAVVAEETRLADLSDNIRCGNALIGPDFPVAARNVANATPSVFPDAVAAGGFDAVIGNPPWGQKEIDKDPVVQRYLRQRYPSSAGIQDLFRPFIELGVRLTAEGGYFGMVLPDIVLLKNYQPTRRFLLDHLSLADIDWWGSSFAGATIDVATIIGRKRPAPVGHQVGVAVHDPKRPTRQNIPQADFAANPRQVFNLFLTPEQRSLLQRLADYPRLGDFFEIHEGIHSGNIRRELFITAAVDDTCRELYFGRDEIAPYRLKWHGRYVRLGAMPREKTRERYANLGQPQWHEREKLLVRRTGDHLLAAVDRAGRYASNNFFLVFPKKSGEIDLDGLCALLNSKFMTWYFRTVEPRQGRVFAELKIKHVRDFPLPTRGVELNDLGARRALAACDSALDQQIDRAVCELFGVRPGELGGSGPE